MPAAELTVMDQSFSIVRKEAPHTWIYRNDISWFNRRYSAHDRGSHRSRFGAARGLPTTALAHRVYAAGHWMGRRRARASRRRNACWS